MATERLTELPDGRLLYRLKRPWRDGTSAVIFERQDLMQNSCFAKYTEATGEEFNGDGKLDLVGHFDNQSAGFKFGDTVGILKGRTIDEFPIQGTDSIRIVP